MRKLGFGLMRLPMKDGEIDLEQFKEMADLYLSEGFTYFDTAYMYHDGKSETAFRDAVVKRHPRDSFTLTDKLPMMFVKEKDDLERFFNEQLERTQAGYFDYYWLHNLNSNTYPVVLKTDAFDFILRKQSEGLIKHIGFSFHDSAELLEKILTEHPEAEFVQLQINYVDWDDAGVQSGKCYEVAQAHGKKVIVMEPIKGGSLASLPPEAETLLKTRNPSASIASWAVRFAASPEGVLTVLSGMSNIDQMRDNISYMKDFKPLTDEEKKTLESVVEIYKASVAIPCTACRYCVEGCPMSIPIPNYFALYNKWDLWRKEGAKGFNNQGMYYEHFVVSGAGRASDCIGCGQCDAACPQHIHVSELMPKVSEAFD